MRQLLSHRPNEVCFVRKGLHLPLCSVYSSKKKKVFDMCNNTCYVRAIMIAIRNG